MFVCHFKELRILTFWMSRDKRDKIFNLDVLLLTLELTANRFIGLCDKSKFVVSIFYIEVIMSAYIIKKAKRC